MWGWCEAGLRARPLQLMRVWCCSVVRCLRTHERTSLRTGAKAGARPAQGAATTTDVGLVRRLVRDRHKARALHMMGIAAHGHKGPHLAGYARCLFSSVWAMESLFREGGGETKCIGCQSSHPYPKFYAVCFYLLSTFTTLPSALRTMLRPCCRLCERRPQAS